MLYGTAMIAMGSLGALAWSFLLAAAVLRLKHWRNGRLIARGAMPIKDAIFSTAFGVMATLLGVASVSIAVVWVGPSWYVVAIAALTPPSVLALVPLCAIGVQLRNG